MTAVSAKTPKLGGFADVSRQVFANPYTKKTPATLLLTSGFLSFIKGVGRFLPQFYICILQEEFLLRFCKRNEFI